MILKLYIASVILCWLLAFLTKASIKQRARREGKTTNKKERGIFETMHGSIPCFVPVFNIFLALIFIFKYEELYKKATE
jgi:hypothetical protein